MRILEKLFCGHKWKQLSKSPTYETSDKYKAGEIPMFTDVLYVCEICGKFKKIRI